MRMLLSLVMVGCIGGLVPPAGACPAQAPSDGPGRVDRVWVHLRQHLGGIHARPIDIIVDSNDLTPGQVKRLRKLIEEVRFFECRPAALDLGRRQDSLTVEMDGRRRTVNWNALHEPEDLQPLVYHVQILPLLRQLRESPPPLRPDHKGGVRPDSIFMDIIGELEVPDFFPEFAPDGVRILVKVNGRTFWLDLSGNPDFATKISALTGKKVAVTGRLKYRPTLRAFASRDGAVIEEPVIVVTTLEPVKGPAVAPVVRVEITGTLQYSELEKRPPIPVWEITVKDRTYRLEFVARGLRPKAEKLVGQRVQVTGTLQGDTVLVTDISAAPAT